MADTPKANKVVWTKHPEIRPKTVAKPNFFPLTILCVSTKILSGPGERDKIAVAKTKDKRVSNIKIKLYILSLQTELPFLKNKVPLYSSV